MMDAEGFPIRRKKHAPSVPRLMLDAALSNPLDQTGCVESVVFVALVYAAMYLQYVCVFAIHLFLGVEGGGFISFVARDARIFTI